MLAAELISERLFPLKKKDSCLKALEILNELKVSDLPVVEDDHCIGYVNSLDLSDATNKKKSIESVIYTTGYSTVLENQHYFEIFRLFASSENTTLPVLDGQGNFKGILGAHDLFTKLKNAAIFNEPGGILIISSTQRDYSFADITRIIEYNNARILGMVVHTIPDSQNIEIAIKLNTHDLNIIIATFERYNYNITATFMRGDDTTNMKDRFDSLMKYLDL